MRGLQNVPGLDGVSTSDPRDGRGTTRGTWWRAFARDWDVQVIGPPELIELELRSGRYVFAQEFVAWFETLKANALLPDPQHSGYSWPAFELAMERTGRLAKPSTKGAISNVTAARAQMLADRGIRVNAGGPGPIWTPLIPSTMPAEKAASFGQRPRSRARVSPRSWHRPSCCWPRTRRATCRGGGARDGWASYVVGRLEYRGRAEARRLAPATIQPASEQALLRRVIDRYESSSTRHGRRHAVSCALS